MPDFHFHADPELVANEQALNETNATGYDDQYIAQLGSTVATSLSVEEAGDKHVAILKVLLIRARISRSEDHP